MYFEDLQYIRANEMYIDMISQKLYNALDMTKHNYLTICKIIMIKFVLDLPDDTQLYKYYRVSNPDKDELLILKQVNYNLMPFL